MSLFKQESLDPLDIDRYLDLDNVGFSPSSSARGKSIQTPEFQTPRPSQAFVAPLNATKNFSGPSHQYDLHQQQTGLPIGALANSLAATQRTNFQLGAVSTNFNYAGLDTSDDIFDFNALNTQDQSFGGSTDIDMDFDSPIDGLFPSGSNADSTFIDPTAIGGQDDAPSPARNEIVRLWPGMHTQQAALAKQQQQEEIQRQQQLKSQQPQGDGAHKRNTSRTSANGTRPTDPMVEERISRLLNQMRHGSVGSSNEDATTPQASNSQSLRNKKEEEDMDEDERLLASEEGKKLSSKERRQLRNKVSARAFRSRRKEYIGQLEGEINQKCQDNDDLRTENDALKAENTRLTDLSKMLLASPAFTNFLNDLSASGVPSLPESVVPQQAMTVQQPAQQQQQPRKEANSQQRQMHSQQNNSNQSSMNAIPENTTNFSAIDTNGSWGTGLDFGFNTQVFAVIEMPQGPAVDGFDADILSGKSSNFTTTSTSDAKSNLPVIDFMPASKGLETLEMNTQPKLTSGNNDEDPAFALFADVPSPNAVTPSTESSMQIFGEIQFEKAVERIELIVDDESESSIGLEKKISVAASVRFDSLCASLDSLSARF